MLLCATVPVFLLSCEGGRGKKTANDTMADIDSMTVNVAPAANAPITTPQSMMTAVHKVANFAKWKASYDAHDSMRLANQVHSYIIGRGVQDSNMVLVVVKVDDMDKARAFAKDPSLKTAMQKGGVMGTPSFNFITILFQETAPVDTDIRVRTTFKVKDWDTWRKAFEEGKQNRLDNGIMVRAYGHEADDNHKVVVVTVVTDTAKANAYWKSDMLKNRMAAAGVIGDPERFVYRLAYRY